MRCGCACVSDQPTTSMASLTSRLEHDNLLLPCTLGPGTYIARRIGSHILYVILFARPVHLNVLFFVLAAAPCCPFHDPSITSRCFSLLRRASEGVHHVATHAVFPRIAPSR